jgi:hypothetical protein
MSHIRILAVVLALGSIILSPMPAHAGSVWDANDPGHRLDIRWVGVYQQADGRIRVTVSFYGRVRNRWFNRPLSRNIGIPATSANLQVGFSDNRINEFFFAGFLRTRHRGLVAWLCETGSGCSTTYGVHVGRPDRRTIRVRIPRFAFDDDFGPVPGWYFRGVSWTHDFKTKLDRTRWGVFN